MLTPIQGISFEVAKENETVTVTVQTPPLTETLPPLTPEQREVLEKTHPELQKQAERWMR